MCAARGGGRRTHGRGVVAFWPARSPRHAGEGDLEIGSRRLGGPAHIRGVGIKARGWVARLRRLLRCLGVRIIISGQRTEGRHEFVRRVEAVLRRRLEALTHDAIEGFGHFNVERARRRRGRAEARHHLFHRVLGVGQALPPDQAVVEDQPERVNVGAAVDLFALRLLWRHVLERADDRARSRLRAAALDRAGDAEVHDQGVARVLLDHDVFGLEVAMHDTLRVGRFQTCGHLRHDAGRARDVELAFAPQQIGQRLPVDERHRQVLHALDVADVVNAHHVLVRDLAREQELALEALLEIACGGGVGLQRGPDQFHRDADAELPIKGVIHGAHAAGAEQLDHRVARPDLIAGQELRLAKFPLRARRRHHAGGIDRVNGIRRSRSHRRRAVDVCRIRRDPHRQRYLCAADRAEGGVRRRRLAAFHTEPVGGAHQGRACEGHYHAIALERGNLALLRSKYDRRPVARRRDPLRLLAGDARRTAQQAGRAQRQAHRQRAADQALRSTGGNGKAAIQNEGLSPNIWV